MPVITTIQTTLPRVTKRKRVAAYARVSMDCEQLLHSLSAQVSYYSSLIQKNPEWEYAGVYIDEGITGTSTKHRDEFKRLIADCEAGKIDLILVKSISRFARDTVDLLDTVRHLKDIGVEVRFERENISTFTGDGEVLLTLLASFAQEESESLSRNEKWAIKKKFEKGMSNTSLRCFGYDWDSETGTCIRIETKQKEVKGALHMSRVKRGIMILAVIVISMLIVPMITIHTVKADAGMLVTLLLFFAVYPIVSVVVGVLAGKDIKFFWACPLVLAVLFWCFHV